MILRMNLFLGAVAVSAMLATTSVSAVINTSTHPCFIDNKTLPERRTPINMTELTSRRLTNIIDLMGQDGQMQAALTAALELEPRVRNGRYEHAITLQTLGYIYVQLERYQESIPVLRQSAEYDAMPETAQQQTLWLLVNMYAAVEDWTNTIAWLDRWCIRSVTPTSEALILGSQARAQMGQHRDAIPFVRQAIERADEPKENWFQLWLAMHYELREYPQAANVLETMVSLWPTNKRYWDQLSGLYMELQDDDKSLATMALIYRNGMTTEEDEIMTLVRMYLYMENPHEGASILDREISAGRVDATEEHLELLGNAWAQARENQNAVEALGRAGELSEDGEILVRRAQILVQMQLWSDVIDTVDAAVAKGGLNRPGNAYLLQGMAAAELKRFEEAVIYFRRAAAFPETRTQARDWARYMQEELAVGQSG
jgi:tetratricopeptide (TPR) repeat protein